MKVWEYGSGVKSFATPILSYSHTPILVFTAL
jgi:hypothetical protein